MLYVPGSAKDVCFPKVFVLAIFVARLGIYAFFSIIYICCTKYICVFLYVLVRY